MKLPEFMTVMGSTLRIPWAMIAPHENQAQANHYQSLRRLNQRGGLAPSEALAVLQDRKWVNIEDKQAEVLLGNLIREFVSR